MQLEVAQKIVIATLASARSHKFKPLAVVVLDARGALRAAAAEDGASLKRARSPSARRMARLPWDLDHAPCSHAPSSSRSSWLP